MRSLTSTCIIPVLATLSGCNADTLLLNVQFNESNINPFAWLSIESKEMCKILRLAA